VRQRLHPLTPLLKGAKLVVFAAVAISWRGLSDLGPLHWLATMAAVLVAAVLVSAVVWLVTGYEIVGRELRVHEGLVSRRTRTIPLERVQAIDVVRPLLARVFGLAELRLEVIGASKTEAPLAYLTVAGAASLRTRLIALSTGVPHAPAAVAPRFTVDNRRLLLAQLLTPQALTVPVGLVFVAWQASLDPTWTLIGAASTITAFLGVFQVPVRRVLDEWDLTLGTDTAAVRVRQGLLNKRSRTVPPHRVQGLRVTWPLLWRSHGWSRARIDVAGYAGNGEEQLRAGTLVPVAATPTTLAVAAAILGAAVHAPTGTRTVPGGAADGTATGPRTDAVHGAEGGADGLQIGPQPDAPHDTAAGAQTGPQTEVPHDATAGADGPQPGLKTDAPHDPAGAQTGQQTEVAHDTAAGADGPQTGLKTDASHDAAGTQTVAPHAAGRPETGPQPDTSDDGPVGPQPGPRAETPHDAAADAVSLQTGAPDGAAARTDGVQTGPQAGTTTDTPAVQAGPKADTITDTPDGADGVRAGRQADTAFDAFDGGAGGVQAAGSGVWGGGMFDAPPVDAAALPVAPPPRRARWLAPLAWSRIGIAVTDTVVAVREGVLTRELVVVPLLRIQSVRVTQGPLQRALDLATVHVDTAGGLRATGRHRATADAYALADLLATRSRTARRRAASAVPHGQRPTTR
jgi:putative membrane protein